VKIISFVPVRELAGKGRSTFLAQIWDRSNGSPLIESVLVVHEILKVISSNLLGMPPDRDIDFFTDLEPDISPICIPSY